MTQLFLPNIFDILRFGVLVILGVAFGQIMVKSYLLASVLIVGVILFAFYYKHPLRAVSLLLLFIPFSSMDIFNTRIMGIVGAKPLNLLFMFVLFICLLNIEKSFALSNSVKFFAITLIVILGIAIFRAFPHLEMLSYLKNDNFTPSRFVLSHLLKPLIFFAPFVLIPLFAHTKDRVMAVANMLVLSIVLLSIFLIYLYIFQLSNKGDFEQVRQYFAGSLKMHGNALANFYIIAFPVLLARFFRKKSILSILSLLIVTPVFGILYSRTAYISLLFSLLVYFFMTKRTKYLPLFLIGVFLLFGALSFNTIKERAFNKLETKNLNSITAGRVDTIWLPLIKEYSQDYKKLLVGQGRFSVRISDSYKRGNILAVGHPHNMYLEVILDSGILGFVVFFGAFGAIVYKIFNSLRTIEDLDLKEYQYAAVTSILAFLLSGLVGRSFFPQLPNAYIWIILGYSIAIVGINHRNRRVNYAIT